MINLFLVMWTKFVAVYELVDVHNIAVVALMNLRTELKTKIENIVQTDVQEKQTMTCSLLILLARAFSLRFLSFLLY